MVGAQGQSLVEERLRGGVAGVITNTVKPVLVVPTEKKKGEDKACEPVARCNFNDHILFSTFFSKMADNAFAYVEQLVAHGVQKVTGTLLKT